MRLPLPLPIILAVAVPLLLGIVALPLAYGFGHPTPQDGHVWRPPASAPAWAGYELVGVDIWGGAGTNAQVADYALVLRCTERPRRNLTRSAWPGAGGWGSEEVRWTGTEVTLTPSLGSKATPQTFTRAEAEKLACP